MDHLVETIAILTDEERREFRAFIQRRRSKKERKDLELFDILASQDELKPREIAGKLYGKPMLNAYHTLRKRLVKELLDFTMLKSMDEDNTSYSTLLGMLAMARRLIDKNRADIARRYLDKAEQLALQTETFDLLDNIYNLKIRYAHELDMDVTQIIRSAQKYREEAEVEEKVKAKSQVRQFVGNGAAGDTSLKQGDVVPQGAEAGAIVIKGYRRAPAFGVHPDVGLIFMGPTRRQADRAKSKLAVGSVADDVVGLLQHRPHVGDVGSGGWVTEIHTKIHGAVGIDAPRAGFQGMGRAKQGHHAQEKKNHSFHWFGFLVKNGAPAPGRAALFIDGKRMENVTGWRENLGALGRAVSNRDSQDDEITRILIASIGA